MKKHFSIKIYGLVQAVFFRVSAKEKAESLRIKGFARNEKDGTVYIEAEGTDKNLKRFLLWCHEGPSAASVDEVKITEGFLKNFPDFST